MYYLILTDVGFSFFFNDFITSHFQNRHCNSYNFYCYDLVRHKRILYLADRLHISDQTLHNHSVQTHIYVLVDSTDFMNCQIHSVSTDEGFHKIGCFFGHDLFSRLFMIVCKPFFFIWYSSTLFTGHIHFFDNTKDVHIVNVNYLVVVVNFQDFHLNIFSSWVFNDNFSFRCFNCKERADYYFWWHVKYHVEHDKNYCTNSLKGSQYFSLILNSHNQWHAFLFRYSNKNCIP